MNNMVANDIDCRKEGLPQFINLAVFAELSMSGTLQSFGTGIEQLPNLTSPQEIVP
jgi:hypothetical protein